VPPGNVILQLLTPTPIPPSQTTHILNDVHIANKRTAEI